MEQMICVALVLSAAVMFCTECIPPALTSLLVLLCLILTGILTPAEAFSGFSNSTVILFASVFVIAAALDKTDFLSVFAHFIYRNARNERSLILTIALVTAALSSVLSTTGLAAILIPLIVGIADSTGFSRSRLLLPMAVAGSLGGGIFVLGGGGNGAVYAALENLDLGMSFSFLDMPKVGLPATAIAILYIYLVGTRMLPDRQPAQESAVIPGPSEKTRLPKRQQIVVYVIVALTVLAMIFEAQTGIKMYLAAMIGAICIVLSRLLSEQEAIAAIRWPTLLMFAGILPLSTALIKTGAAQTISNGIRYLAGSSQNQYLIVGIVLFVSMLFTQLMSNSAALALFCPLAGSIALELGADPRALIMAAALGASASVCTPVASPPEAMIYTVGGYKALDYLKFGTPICVLILFFGPLYLSWLWPLF